ncbi:hypothetical protein AKO1_014642 [Acrasis kona]|uniref:Uncharacterized protein n=1 Tax=Acrasis kona TaxID=1008807 RepID=A0AAW2Z1F4_9EUKA
MKNFNFKLNIPAVIKANADCITVSQSESTLDNVEGTVIEEKTSAKNHKKKIKVGILLSDLFECDVDDDDVVEQIKMQLKSRAKLTSKLNIQVYHQEDQSMYFYVPEKPLSVGNLGLATDQLRSYKTKLEKTREALAVYEDENRNLRQQIEQLNKKVEQLEQQSPSINLNSTPGYINLPYSPVPTTLRPK